MNEIKKEIKVEVGFTKFTFDDVNAAVLFAENAAKYINKDRGYDDVSVYVSYKKVNEEVEEDEDE